MMPDRGVVLLLALDAVDPRLPSDQRALSAATALEIDPLLAGSLWTTTLCFLLGGLSQPDGVDEVMSALMTASLAMVEP